MAFRECLNSTKNLKTANRKGASGGETKVDGVCQTGPLRRRFCLLFDFLRNCWNFDGSRETANTLRRSSSFLCRARWTSKIRGGSEGANEALHLTFLWSILYHVFLSVVVGFNELAADRKKSFYIQENRRFVSRFLVCGCWLRRARS